MWPRASVAEDRSNTRGSAPAMRHDDEARDLASLIGGEEFIIILEGHAAIRIAAGPEHVAMREHADAAVHVAVTDWVEPQGRDPVEQLLAGLESIGLGRDHAPILLADGTRIVEVAAAPGMRREPLAVRHIDGVRRNVIDGCAASDTRRGQLAQCAEDPLEDVAVV